MKKEVFTRCCHFNSNARMEVFATEYEIPCGIMTHKKWPNQTKKGIKWMPNTIISGGSRNFRTGKERSHSCATVLDPHLTKLLLVLS